MGDPWFKIRGQQLTEQLFVFSSNYELYASMSNRVMACLEELAPRVELYSVDEMFLDLRGLEASISFEAFSTQLRKHVYACTRLTIGMGTGMSKTLAKSAQWGSKEWPAFKGILVLTPDNPARTAKLLSLQPVEEVWGVGDRIARKLNTMGITTALQLARSNPAFIRRNFSVVLERTVRELNGESCIALERIWRDEHRYAKAGVMLNDFSGSGIAQLNLFDEQPPRPHSQELMSVVDGINHSGLGQVWFAGRGIAPQWKMKREMLSPAYTTRWQELPLARIG